MSTSVSQPNDWREEMREVLNSTPDIPQREKLQEAVSQNCLLSTAKILGIALTRKGRVLRSENELGGNYNKNTVVTMTPIQNLPQALYHLGTAPPENRTDYPRLLPILEMLMSEYIREVKDILSGDADFSEDPDFWSRFTLEAMHLEKAFQVYQEKSSLHNQGLDLPTPGTSKTEQKLEVIGRLFVDYLRGDFPAAYDKVEKMLSNANVSDTWRPALNHIREFTRRQL